MLSSKFYLRFWDTFFYGLVDLKEIWGSHQLIPRHICDCMFGHYLLSGQIYCCCSWQSSIDCITYCVKSFANLSSTSYILDFDCRRIIWLSWYKYKKYKFTSIHPDIFAIVCLDIICFLDNLTWQTSIDCITYYVKSFANLSSTFFCLKFWELLLYDLVELISIWEA